MVESTPEPAGPILGLWVFAALLGNCFAGYWLLQSFLLSHTSVSKQALKYLRRCRTSISHCFRATADKGEKHFERGVTNCYSLRELQSSCIALYHVHFTFGPPIHSCSPLSRWKYNV